MEGFAAYLKEVREIIQNQNRIVEEAHRKAVTAERKARTAKSEAMISLILVIGIGIYTVVNVFL